MMKSSLITTTWRSSSCLSSHTIPNCDS